MADKYKIKFYEVSALTNIGVDDCFSELVKKVHAIKNGEPVFDDLLTKLKTEESQG